jgi:hypothetical protein
MPNSSAAALASAPSPDNAADSRREVGPWSSLFTIASAVALTERRP